MLASARFRLSRLRVLHNSLKFLIIAGLRQAKDDLSSKITLDSLGSYIQHRIMDPVNRKVKIMKKQSSKSM